jgi:hypothetical protein
VAALGLTPASRRAQDDIGKSLKGPHHDKSAAALTSINLAP